MISRRESVPFMPESHEVTPPVRMIVADDHPLVLYAVESLIAGFPNLQIVASVQTVPQLFEAAATQDFDVALIDLYIPGQDDVEGHAVIRRFCREFPEKTVVVLTMETDPAALREVAELPVGGLISKRDRLDLIPVAIMSAVAHERYCGPVVRDILAQAVYAQRREAVHRILTRREFEVLTHYASGMGVTEIAGLLGRSVKTISAQKCAAMKKLSLGSDVELYRFAVDCGVVPGEQT
jgi:two-component system, NarL family, captular synthesis response regulator RcsB